MKKILEVETYEGQYKQTHLFLPSVMRTVTVRVLKNIKEKLWFVCFEIKGK